MRRLPIYIALDVSGSMMGEPIESVRQGVKNLLVDLKNDPTALESVYLSFVLFSSEATATPLKELTGVDCPELAASGYTGLGAALDLIGQRVDAEVVKSSPGVKGDYRPIVFLMTDGGPTDAWEEPAARLRARRLNVIACAAPGADKVVLQKITETVVELCSLQPDTFKAFFKWVSASIKVTSTRLGAPIELPALPAGLSIVP